MLDLAEDGFWSGLWGTIDRLQDLLVTPDDFETRARERATRLHAAATAQLDGDDLSPKERAELEVWTDDYLYLPGAAGVVALLYRAYQAELARRARWTTLARSWRRTAC